jgi:hypothetical protein
LGECTQKALQGKPTPRSVKQREMRVLNTLNALAVQLAVDAAEVLPALLDGHGATRRQVADLLRVGGLAALLFQNPALPKHAPSGRNEE